MTKDQIRSHQKELRNKLSEEERIRLSRSIHKILFQTNAYQNCSTLLTFVSFQSEADTHEIISQAFRDGKKVYIPRVETQGMEFYRIYHMEGLEQSKFGVLEPPLENTEKYMIDSNVATQPKPVYNQSSDDSDKELSNEQYPDLMLLPGLAFDSKGNRIGYGAGYYDRFLNDKQATRFYKTALAYDFQIIDKVPAEVFDVKADMIITPTRSIKIQ